MVLIKSILTGLASLAVVAAQSSVLDLIPSNFDSLAIGGTPALVEFFAPVCYSACLKVIVAYANSFSGVDIARRKDPSPTAQNIRI